MKISRMVVTILKEKFEKQAKYPLLPSWQVCC